MAADGDGVDAAGAVQAAAFAALDRRLDPSSRAPLAVGLSGGGDSLALLVLALTWARGAGRRVLALTVDHGLNPDSGRWTAEAGRSARALGADWRPLTWAGPKPSCGLPAAARRARHALLAETARNAGAPILLLGHTADDVAESDLIRRDTPVHGRMREWAPSPVWPEGRGVFLLRPLLAARRGDLRKLLVDGGLAWLDDPANMDLRFARSRARQLLAQSPDPRAPAFLGEESVLAIPWGGPEPEVSPAGVVSLSVQSSEPAQLCAAIVCASGREAPPPGRSLARLADRVRIGESGTATLGGARVAWSGEQMAICRELGRRPPEARPLTAGEPIVFDGRFEVTADPSGWRLAPLAGHASRLPESERRGLSEIPADARPALPVLLDATGAPRLPRPFGDGPAEARGLVGSRLAAAFGRIDSERALAQDLRPCAVHGA